MKNKIITIGLSPCWDRTIEINGIDWNEHKVISSQNISPAGKALNINKALAWLGEQSIAAGLWGSEDFEQMKKACRVGFSPRGKAAKITIQMTKTPGRTRENITVIDTANKRQIHLRSKSTLANNKSMKMLKQDLQKIIRKNNLCVFAGAMPQETVGLVEFAKKKGAAVCVDTSGPALKKIVSKGGLFLIKPNIEELGELIGSKIKNTEDDIIKASKKLLNKVNFILVSRGEKGAILLFSPMIYQGVSEPRPLGSGNQKDVIAISAKYTGKKYDVLNTVACGDYLLAGFIKSYLAPRPAGGFVNSLDNLRNALETGIKSATAKAFGLNDNLSWFKVKNNLRVKS